MGYNIEDIQELERKAHLWDKSSRKNTFNLTVPEIVNLANKIAEKLEGNAVISRVNLELFVEQHLRLEDACRYSNEDF